MDDALMGAMTIARICAGNLMYVSPHDYQGILTGFQLTVTV